MTYKETLFFVTKCLTISLDKKNKKEIEQELKTTTVDWEAVVKVSTAQFVFPALYINFKKANFLNYLPEELVNYMKHITDLNRERNVQIIAQAKKINALLLAKNVTPIFIKGTGNLVDDLYDDIGERMVGDIDVFFKKNETEKAYKILKNNGYIKQESSSYIVPNHRHLPRLVHKTDIAAIELHKETVRGKYVNQFNYDALKSDLKLEQEFCVLGVNHQLVLTILSKQINNYGYQLKLIALRGFYDTFLLSKKIDTLNSIKEFPSLFLQTNSFLAITSAFFNYPTSIKYEDDKIAKTYIRKSIASLQSKKRIIKFQIFLQKRVSIILKAIFNTEYRNFLLSRIKLKLNA